MKNASAYDNRELIIIQYKCKFCKYFTPLLNMSSGQYIWIFRIFTIHSFIFLLDLKPTNHPRILKQENELLSAYMNSVCVCFYILKTKREYSNHTRTKRSYHVICVVCVFKTKAMIYCDTHTLLPQKNIMGMEFIT